MSEQLSSNKVIDLSPVLLVQISCETCIFLAFLGLSIWYMKSSNDERSVLLSPNELVTQADDAFNNLWQGSTKREKQLIIEPARQTTHECAVNQPAQQNSNVMNARLPHMMESILTNMQSNMKPT